MIIIMMMMMMMMIILLIMMKYVQGNITNELITRSLKIKDIYNNY